MILLRVNIPRDTKTAVSTPKKARWAIPSSLYGITPSPLPRVNNMSSEQLRKEGEFTFTSNLAGICWVEALKTARVDAASNKIHLTRAAIGL